MRSPYVRMNQNENEADTIRNLGGIEKYERCSFCHSKLIFNHDLNLSHLEVVETGQCPGCGVAVAPKKFTLH